MTLEHFADLVGRMRSKQREFFRTRDQIVLRESKDLERRVDAAIGELSGRKSPSLFEEPPKSA